MASFLFSGFRLRLGPHDSRTSPFPHRSATSRTAVFLCGVRSCLSFSRRPSWIPYGWRWLGGGIGTLFGCLQSAFPDGPGGTEELLLLFAGAEAGWGNWTQVRALLEDPLETAARSMARTHGTFWGGLWRHGEHWEEAEAAYGQVLTGQGAEGSSHRFGGPSAKG